MKKASITIRVPIFFDLDLDLKDKDYDTLVEEWDQANFGRVSAIISKYIDIDSLDIPGTQERFGEAEVVDLREVGEAVNKTKLEQEIVFTSISPKGKLN